MMTIHVGWWVVPLVITLAAFGWCAFINYRDSGGGYLDAVANVFNMLIFAVVPSLVAWLVWALLK